MASFEYTVTAITHGDRGGWETVAPPSGVPWSHDSATMWARKNGAKMAEGSEIEIHRRPWGSHGHGKLHRAYVVNEDGIVRRTDR